MEPKNNNQTTPPTNQVDPSPAPKPVVPLEAPPVVIDLDSERPHIRRPRVSFFEEWRRARPKSTTDNSFRNFLILASVLGIVVILLSVLIIDQLAFGGRIKSSAFAVFGGSGEEQPPEIPPEPPKTNGNQPKPGLEPPKSTTERPENRENQDNPQNDTTPVAGTDISDDDNPDPKAVPLTQEEPERIEQEEKEREAQIAEEERIHQEQLAAQAARDEAEARIVAEERRKIADELRTQIDRGLFELPEFLDFNIPRLSAFGRIEERQLEGQVFPEFGPFYSFLNETELKFVDFYTDPVWKHSLVRDSRTSLSRGWNLRATDGKISLDLARFVITEDGLKVTWNDVARNIANLDASNKLAFARLETKLEFEGVVFADSIHLFVPTRVAPLEYKNEMNRANSPQTVIPNVFSVPQWDTAFKGIKLQDQFELEIELAAVLPRNYDMRIAGSGDKRFIEFRAAATEVNADPEKEPTLVNITAEIDKELIIFTDTSFEVLQEFQNEKTRLRREIREEEAANSPETAEKEARIAGIDDFVKKIETARADLKAANLRFHYRAYLKAPEYDRIQNPTAKLLLLRSN